MDFIDGLPRSRKSNKGIWVVVDRLTKNTHFIPVKSKWTAPWLAFVYLREIVRLHRVPSSIVSDRDPIFTREFWKSLQKAVGTQLRLSTAYHPQTDGQTERVNHILEDLLRLCILDFGGTWEEHLPLAELPDRLSSVHDVSHGRNRLVQHRIRLHANRLQIRV